MLIMMQVIYFFPNLDVTMTWIAHHVNLMFLASTIILGVSVLFFCFFNNLILAISLSSLVMLIVAIANYYKMLVVGEPIYPSDLSMISNIDEIIGYVKNLLSPTLIIGLIVVMDGFMKVSESTFNIASTTALVITAGFMVYTFIRYFGVFREILRSTDGKYDLNLPEEMRAKKERTPKN